MINATQGLNSNFSKHIEKKTNESKILPLLKIKNLKKETQHLGLMFAS
jgi:hypothetical protein